MTITFSNQIPALSHPARESFVKALRHPELVEDQFGLPLL